MRLKWQIIILKLKKASRNFTKDLDHFVLISEHANCKFNFNVFLSKYVGYYFLI